MPANALVQLQARYNHCGEAASEKCLSAATLVRRLGIQLLHLSEFAMRRELAATTDTDLQSRRTQIPLPPAVGHPRVGETGRT